MDGYISTNSSKLTPIGDGAALLKPSARWVNAPAPDSLYQGPCGDEDDLILLILLKSKINVVLTKLLEKKT